MAKLLKFREGQAEEISYGATVVIGDDGDRVMAQDSLKTSVVSGNGDESASELEVKLRDATVSVGGRAKILREFVPKSWCRM